MDIDTFQDLYEQAVADRPGIFQLAHADPKATDWDITKVERALSVKLPESYCSFLREFGGGEFGLLTIFSAGSSSEWYLPKKVLEAKKQLPHGLLAFSDDFAGGYYAFPIVDGVAQDKVLYWNTDGADADVVDPSGFFDFVAKYAFQPA